MFDHILFDLDGTLTDPAEGILNSLRYALAKYNIEENDEDRLKAFIGPPLHESFRTIYNFNEEETKEIIGHYREYYGRDGMYQNFVIAGIPELLRELKQAGKQLYVATTKVTEFAQQVLDHYQLSQYFTLVIGGNEDGTRTAKVEIIDEILKTIPGVEKSRIVMIGDRKYDMIGATAHGIKTIAVTFGYGAIAELKAENPHYLVNSVAELSQVLL